jgi:tetratricopeptide (TPR) repeat protein
VAVWASTLQPVHAQSSQDYLTPTAQQYNDLITTAEAALSAGQMTQAINAFEKARPYAPTMSLPVIHNNLAAAYIRRGNFYHNQQKNPQAAIHDFRKAYFWLGPAWPPGVDAKPLHLKNMEIVRENLEINYENLKIPLKDASAHLNQAKELRRQGAFAEAVVEYDWALQSNPRLAEAPRGMGDLLNVLNMPNPSKMAYRKALAILGPNAKDDLLVLLGSVESKTGENQMAAQHFDQALVINPQNQMASMQLERLWRDEVKFNPANAVAHANLARALQKQDRFDEALQQYNAAEHFASLDPNTDFAVKKLIRLNMGTLYQARKQYDMALNAYNTVLQGDPNDKTALYYKASLYKQAGQLDDAKKLYGQLLATDPGNTQAQNDLFDLILQGPHPEADLATFADRYTTNALVQAKVAETFHQRKAYPQAITFYRRALAINPKLVSAQVNLGAALQAYGDTEGAMTAYKQTLVLDPGNQPAKDFLKATEEAVGYQNYQQAVALQQKGQYAESIPKFEAALKITPNDAGLWAAYGVSLQNANQLEPAKAAYNKSLSLEANQAQIHYYLGTVYHQQNQLPQAKAAYQKALSLDNALADATTALKSIQSAEESSAIDAVTQAMDNKQWVSGLALANKALAVSPNNAMLHYYKGSILGELKRPAEAIAAYQKAVNLDPNMADAYYALGLTYDGLKQTPAADKAFKRYLELAGNDAASPYVQYVKERLGLATPGT